MRKQIRGLSVLVEGEMEHNPFTGDMYLFCSRNRKLLKVLYWDKIGFAIWLVGCFATCSPLQPGKKKLEKAKFPWPQTEEQAREISAEEFKMLLCGIDFWNTHKELHYTSIL